MTSIQSIKGFKDILPGETELWQSIENTAKDVLGAFGFREIRLPILEKTELFARSIGEATDIVEKEMYTFTDRSGDLLTMRPEATAAVVRAYLQHKIYAQDPVQKYYTIGPMFRRERPQKGRYRQFYQINAEIFGVGSPYADVQLIVMLVELLNRLGVTDAKPHVNSLGCPACRPDYRRALLDFLASREDRLCPDCLRRRETNPLRILDCKVDRCRETSLEAPELTAFLCPECRTHFDTLQQSLDELGIAYYIDKRLVRGLDYYSRTTFEIQTTALGAQSAVAGGGRYDGLVKTLGGPDIPATGFAIGFDRLAEIVAAGRQIETAAPEIFIAALGAEAQARAFPWLAALNRSGITAEMLFENKSLKSLMKRAGKLEARYVLIVGENEMAAGIGQLRDMATREQTPLALDRVVEALRQQFGGTA
ncbi:MAG: histidine--tRNA ligase [Desulfobacterales bacterium]|nr:histidine--tRNA ligase [Desulfobacterales bacterium]